MRERERSLFTRRFPQGRHSETSQDEPEVVVAEVVVVVAAAAVVAAAVAAEVQSWQQQQLERLSCEEHAWAWVFLQEGRSSGAHRVVVVERLHRFLLLLLLLHHHDGAEDA